MGYREKIEEKIKKKEQEIQEYQGKISEAQALLTGATEALRLIPRDQAAVGRASEGF